jgi:pimeloyl-ACP methyl ester carboxylesterase
MPKVNANGVAINYEQQGSGEPVVLIPYLAADNACYAFQVGEYAKHFTCFSLDLRGTGASDKPDGEYSTELFADDVAAFIQAAGITRAHVAGLSLGAGVAMWLGVKHPERVLSLSLHGGWTKSDPFLQTVVESWQVLAKALGTVPETTIRGIFPWCFTPELYAAKPEYIQSLADFVRSRPAQPVASFLQHSNAVLAHDIDGIDRITAPTLITCGRRDALTSTRFAEPMKARITHAELHVFENCSHAALYENVEAFNEQTLGFLLRQSGAAVA